MAKIIYFDDYCKTKQETLEEKVNKIEEELNLDGPLTVLTDMAAINLIDYLVDIKDSVLEALDILGYEESDELPWDE